MSLTRIFSLPATCYCLLYRFFFLCSEHSPGRFPTLLNESGFGKPALRSETGETRGYGAHPCVHSFARLNRTYSTEIPCQAEQQRGRTATSRFFAHQALILYTLSPVLAILFYDFLHKLRKFFASFRESFSAQWTKANPFSLTGGSSPFLFIILLRKTP